MNRYVLFISVFLLIAISWQVHLAFAFNGPSQSMEASEIDPQALPTAVEETQDTKDLKKEVRSPEKKETKSPQSPTKLVQKEEEIT